MHNPKASVGRMLVKGFLASGFHQVRRGRAEFGQSYNLLPAKESLVYTYLRFLWDTRSPPYQVRKARSSPRFLQGCFEDRYGRSAKDQRRLDSTWRASGVVQKDWPEMVGGIAEDSMSPRPVCWSGRLMMPARLVSGIWKLDGDDQECPVSRCGLVATSNRFQKKELFREQILRKCCKCFAKDRGVLCVVLPMSSHCSGPSGPSNPSGK